MQIFCFPCGLLHHMIYVQKANISIKIAYFSIMTSNIEPKAAGCLITKEDTSILIGSVTCCFSYCIYGICYSSLSAALPQLAETLHREPVSFGIAYTTR